MIRIGVIGCGLQAATIASYVGVYNDEYEVVAVADPNLENAKSRLAEKKACVSENCQFFKNVDEFVAAAPEVDGIIIGTFCTFHTETACKLEKLGVPIYIEKPVAINLEQLMQLYNTFKNSKTPIEVSLPMRMCALTQKAKAIIDKYTLDNIGGTSIREFKGGYINLKRLDDFDIPEKVDVLKINVEGLEVEVLEGAFNIIQRDKPVILLTSFNRQSECMQFMLRIGYRKDEVIRENENAIYIPHKSLFTSERNVHGTD